MKRTLAFLLSLVIAVAAMAVPASAATKSDVLAELKKTVIGNYVEITEDNMKSPYITVLAENTIRDLNITGAQADELITLVQAGAAVVNRDNGPSAHEYSAAQRAQVVKLVFDAATVLGYKAAFEEKAKPVHKGDVVFSVYDNGKLIFQYDGDPVRRTDVVSAGTTAPAPYVYIFSIAGVVTLLTLAFFVFQKKGRKAQNLAVQG